MWIVHLLTMYLNGDLIKRKALKFIIRASPADVERDYSLDPISDWSESYFRHISFYCILVILQGNVDPIRTIVRNQSYPNQRSRQAMCPVVMHGTTNSTRSSPVWSRNAPSDAFQKRRWSDDYTGERYVKTFYRVLSIMAPTKLFFI